MNSFDWGFFPDDCEKIAIKMIRGGVLVKLLYSGANILYTTRKKK